MHSVFGMMAKVGNRNYLFGYFLWKNKLERDEKKK